MNNIPKYRVWIKEQQKMMDVLDIALDPAFGGVFTWGKAVVDHDTGEHDADKDFWTWDKVELMAWTGWLDQDQNYIYEGDLIKTTNMWSESLTHQVVWGKTQGGNSWQDTETWVMLLPDGRSTPLYPFYGTRHYEVHITGNIWENPEQWQKEK